MSPSSTSSQRTEYKYKILIEGGRVQKYKGVIKGDFAKGF
jgi:hypothetical protein